MRGGARTHRTLAALVVLWTSLWGIVAPFPVPSRTTNSTLLEKKWETLLSRSYLGINGGRSELSWESDYLQGIKRVRRLYCNVGIGFHLQVLPDGRISGVHSENPYSEFASKRESEGGRECACPNACMHACMKVGRLKVS